ncbi:cysteine desulfurase family protein [Virgibacillus sp. 179-BFC.A HS]|uniref:cysteine desulfurase n=1 Tax=Tigheibacillus jepli TaxID=3035914 RepID=A0ABU5CGP5_9BACI|nr:cysteine desulfurase family protein [Virgibacillus sp. 179-BFC.A HS]MDY0405489.1 cysteine desulfurase family protein [Virgibacillus sp. 179-BFC.A HS]
MKEIYGASFGNPSSIHSFGRQARKIMDEARRTVAASIGAKEKEIIFTSGGTEADNMALIGSAMANKDKGNHIIITAMEHHAVLRSAQFLESIGFDVTYLPVQENGQVSVEDLQAALTDKTILVSIMYVNNETGMIQPIVEIGELLKDHQAYFHTDAVQAYGLMEMDVTALGVDMLSVSSHKINGPKGIGFLYAQEDVRLKPIGYGGEQERKRRPGTENVAAIAGFQKAVQLAMKNRDKNQQKYSNFKRLFLNILQNEHVHFAINGDPSNMVASIVNLSFPGANVETLLTNFDLSGIAASSGSACTAGSIEPSHVLTAMYGSDDERGKNSIRFSFGSFNTEENIKEAAEKIADIVNRLTSKEGDIK